MDPVWIVVIAVVVAVVVAAPLGFIAARVGTRRRAPDGDQTTEHVLAEAFGHRGPTFITVDDTDLGSDAGRKTWTEADLRVLVTSPRVHGADRLAAWQTPSPRRAHR